MIQRVPIPKQLNQRRTRRTSRSPGEMERRRSRILSSGIVTRRISRSPSKMRRRVDTRRPKDKKTLLTLFLKY